MPTTQVRGSLKLMAYQTGMLASAETIKVVAETLQEWQKKTGKELKIVLDPVCLLPPILQSPSF